MLNQDLVQSIGQQILLIFKYDNNQQYVSVKWSHWAQFDCVVYDFYTVEG